MFCIPETKNAQALLPCPKSVSIAPCGEFSDPTGSGITIEGMGWSHVLVLVSIAKLGLTDEVQQDRLLQDDECQATDASGACALQALQIAHGASNETVPSTENESESLEASLGWVRTLYHQTTPSAGKSILENGFRLGHVGWCGAGIYFATSVQATSGKIKGPDSGAGFIIEAKVNLGRVKQMPWHCTTSPTCNHHPFAKCQDRKDRGSWLKRQGYDSINFQPDPYGPEYVIYDPKRVVSMTGYYLHGDHHHHYHH